MQTISYGVDVKVVNGRNIQSKVNTGIVRSKSAYGARLKKKPTDDSKKYRLDLSP